jgi:PBP1b-binding outer membrane lipoprotein LpoB
LHIIQFALLSFLATGIGCTPAHRIQTGGPESITSTSQIDMQDVQDAASGMIQGLLESGVFQDFKTREGRVAILLLRDHAIVNDTTSRMPMPILTGAIKEELLRSKLVLIASTYKGIAGNAMDPEAAAHARRVALRNPGDQGSSPVPDFSLTGSITELRNRAGSRRELNLQFEMALTNWWINLQPWSKVVRVTKSGDRPAVGF